MNERRPRPRSTGSSRSSDAAGEAAGAREVDVKIDGQGIIDQMRDHGLQLASVGDVRVEHQCVRVIGAPGQKPQPKR